MHVTLEANDSQKIRQLRTWAINFRQHLDRKVLFRLATDPKQHVKNINVRHDASAVIRKRLEEDSNTNFLTNEEVEQLYKLIKDEEDFPILVSAEEFTVQDITHIKGKEDLATKKKVKKDIEENVAVLKAEAALLIVDFGLNTNRFKELRMPLIKTITGILGNMLCEPDHLFIREIINGDGIKVITTNYFERFVEALYFIDEDTAKPFMDIFEIKPERFSFERRQRKASQTTLQSSTPYPISYIPDLVC